MAQSEKNAAGAKMVIEWLRLAVPAKKQDEYLFHDRAIWTAELSRWPGFIGKTVWIEPADPDHIVLVITWHTLRQWKSIPQAVLDETDRRMATAIGTTHPIVESRHFETAG
jgi:uncharacterized protein (TIGR03792 family)